MDKPEIETIGSSGNWSPEQLEIIEQEKTAFMIRNSSEIDRLTKQRLSTATTGQHRIDYSAPVKFRFAVATDEYANPELITVFYVPFEFFGEKSILASVEMPANHFDLLVEKAGGNNVVQVIRTDLLHQLYQAVHEFKFSYPKE